MAQTVKIDYISSWFATLGTFIKIFLGLIAVIIAIGIGYIIISLLVKYWYIGVILIGLIILILRNRLIKVYTKLRRKR